jgi:hypothetical protein
LLYTPKFMKLVFREKHCCPIKILKSLVSP